MYNQKKTLKRHILLRVTLLTLFLSIAYSLTINTVYWWGVDDTTRDYLVEEAKIVENHYIKYKQLPKPFFAFSEYYLTAKALPRYINLALDKNKPGVGQLLVINDKPLTTYVMEYKIDTNTTFFIIHYYDESLDEYDPPLSIESMLIILLIFSFIIGLLLSVQLINGIARQVLSLSTWASNTDSIMNNVPQDQGFKFFEIEDVAETLYKSTKETVEKTEKEKDFLRTLSHELRTPLSITKAALSLLHNKPSTNDAYLTNKLSQIHNANEKMLETTNLLLWLWRDSTYKPDKQMINLNQLINKLFNPLQKQLKSRDIKIELPNTSLSLYIEGQALEVLLSNLIRNAVQHTETGLIRIQYSESSIIISNTGLLVEENKTVLDIEEYGYGLGLYLCKKIVDRMSWHMTVSESQQGFVVEVAFINSEYDKNY